MNVERRLEKLESELTVWQVVSPWLDEFERFESSSAYLSKALGTGHTEDPAHRILLQARRQLKTKPSRLDQNRDLKICASLRQVLLLQTLVLATNGEVEQLIEACNARLDTVRVTIKMLDHFCGSDAKRRAEGAERFAMEAHITIGEILADYRGAKLAVESIANRFFNGRAILLQSIARAMEELFHFVELYAEGIARHLSKTQPADYRSSQTEEAAQKASTVMVDKVIDYAKATVALQFGDKRQALDAVSSHLDEQQEPKAVPLQDSNAGSGPA